MSAEERKLPAKRDERGRLEGKDGVGEEVAEPQRKKRTGTYLEANVTLL